MDFLVLYSDAVTPRQAFDHFIDTVVDREITETHPLGVKRHIAPLLERINDVEESMTTGMLAVAIVVPIVVIAFIVVVVVVLRGRQETGAGNIGGYYDNKGVAMDKLS